MPKDEVSKSKDLRLRAALPRYVRYAALGLMALAILAVVVGFYRARSNSPFRLKSEHTQLSTDVVAEVSSYERVETDNGVPKYYIKADYAKTYADEHQEFQNVYIEVYDAEGGPSDTMTAEEALYVPEPEKNFTAYLNGNVQIETSEALKVKTPSIVYTKKDETGEAEELVEFERDNVKGRSFGAKMKMAEKRIDLLKDVEIEAFESPELAKAKVRYAKINANTATYDQIANRIDLGQNVAINVTSQNGQTTDLQSGRATVMFAESEGKPAQLKTFELFENVHIVSAPPGQPPTNIDSGYALYNKEYDRFELKNGSHIVTTANDKTTDVRSSEAIYERTAGKLVLNGGAEITQGADYLKGDVLNAELFPDSKIRNAVIRGNAFAKQTTTERVTTVAAPELNAFFNDARELQNANAIGQSTVEITPQQASSYSNVVMSAASGIGVSFKGAGLIETLRTDGRTTIQLNAPNTQADSANKRVTADVVKTTFAPNGKDIARAEAAGDAELFVEPLNALPKNYRTTIRAPRFDCEFFPSGNNARVCVAGKKAKTTRVPTVPAERRGTQIITADEFTAKFGERSHDVEILDAVGNAKFTEQDRNAIARQMTFTQSDEVARLRGGEPTAWDSRGRAKAREIDWDTRNNRSSLRGSVSTTYYSRKQIKDAAPFGSSERPVFVTSENAEFDHTAETAAFSGNARGWQENNYVRGNRLVIDQKAGRMTADGEVQSLLYNAKIKQKGKESTTPVYASAGSLAYDRDARLLQYRTSVDIRQGTDRITAESADIWLDENNEVSKTVVEGNVVITQPGRRATGDWAQYTAGDEAAILRGNPAVVIDAENGTSQSSQLTFYMRDNRVITESKTKQNTTGRGRSVYKVKPN
jgi:lipopolysaccharide export system protein LptA